MTVNVSDNEFASAFQFRESAATTPATSDTLHDPIIGEPFSKSDIDALIDAYERASDLNKRLYGWLCTLKRTLAKHAGDTKTSRVRGQNRQAKITQPDQKIEQSILKEAFNSYPQFRDQFLRIASLSVNKREFKKAVNTNGPDDFNTFIEIVKSAHSEPTALPTITIEE